MTQEAQILNHLKEHKSITTIQAFRQYGITRLAARIFDLKDKGYEIDNQRLKLRNGKYVCRYWLKKTPEGTGANFDQGNDLA